MKNKGLNKLQKQTSNKMIIISEQQPKKHAEISILNKHEFLYKTITPIDNTTKSNSKYMLGFNMKGQRKNSAENMQISALRIVIQNSKTKDWEEFIKKILLCDLSYSLFETQKHDPKRNKCYGIAIFPLHTCIKATLIKSATKQLLKYLHIQDLKKFKINLKQSCNPTLKIEYPYTRGEYFLGYAIYEQPDFEYTSIEQ